MTEISRIEVRGVTHLFGATAALRAVDAVFEPGVVHFLEGPNGAGKSTLLSIVGTLLRPTSGSVWYEPIGDDVSLVRPRLGWVAHESHCYRELTGRQNVELAARMYGVDPQLGWERVADRTGIQRFADRSVSTLSRGQRQRVALARALVHSPSLLLLDEPWSGLDAASGDRLTEVVIEERDRGALILVVSHQASLAERLEAKRLRLRNGRVVD